ncbi:hypothetical protein ACMWL2_24915, partial [Escherichia coli]|uniref:hypothetical protein n=4 Tax=Escherichia coli TaxID=562 RepID=UPI0039E01672
VAFGLMHTERTGSVATTTVSTGTLRRSKTSMNPKRLAFWRAFFVLRPPTKDRKCNNAIFLRFYAQTEKKHVFPRPDPQKRVTNVLSALHGYARNRCTIGFDRSKGRTGQNDKLSHRKTVNGTRNFSRAVRRWRGVGAQP